MTEAALAASGDFPAVFGNETHISLSSYLDINLAAVEAALADCGAVLLRGFDVASAVEFEGIVERFSGSAFYYEESLSNAVRINHTQRVFTANEAPPDVEIFLHHEMAQTPISPDRLFFYCQSAAETGGATPLCRSEALFAEFSNRHPLWANALIDLGLRYRTVMPSSTDEKSGQGRSWMSTLGAADRAEAEARLTALGYTWDWLEDDRLATWSPVLPGVISWQDNFGTRQSFYHQLLAAYLGWQGVREDPSVAITFGDGSSLPKVMLANMSDLAEAYTYDLAWQDGDVAVVNNKIVMHGRRPYSGKRKRLVLVSMSKLVP